MYYRKPYQFVAVFEISLLNLRLSRGIKVVSICGPRIDVFDDGEDVDDVLVGEDFSIVQGVFFENKLNSHGLAKASHQADLLQTKGFTYAVNII